MSVPRVDAWKEVGFGSRAEICVFELLELPNTQFQNIEILSKEKPQQEKKQLYVCVCVCVYVWVCGVFVYVCACVCGMLICFVSPLGSHEMGRHKLPINV